MVLPDNDLRKWEISDHTKIKHEILNKYLSGWMRILGNSAYKTIKYIDGFAGRGEYNDGSVGSPIIAINSFRRVAPRSNVEFFFIEKNSSNFSNLEKKLYNNKMMMDNVYLYNKEFAEVWTTELSSRNITPSLIFLDPFGFSGIPMDINKEIMQKRSIELLIILMVRDINRFINSISHENTITSLFGTDEWKDYGTIQGANNRIERLKDLYIKQLKEYVGAKYVWPFEVYMDDMKKVIYYVIHVTNNFKGFKLMKGVTYRVGGIEGRYAYFGPDQVQLRLDDIISISDLKEKLLKDFSGKEICFDAILEETYHRYTRFIEKDYRAAIKQLEKEGKVKIKRITSKTEKGLSGKDKIYFP